MPLADEFIKMNQYVRQRKLQNQYQQRRAELGQNPSMEDLTTNALQFTDPSTTAHYGLQAQTKSADTANRLQMFHELSDYKIKALEQQRDLSLQRLKGDEDKRMLKDAYDKQILELTQARDQSRREIDLMKIDLARQKLDQQGANLSPEDKLAYSAGLREITKDDANAQTVVQIENAIKRWQELQPNVTTGRISGMRPAVGQPQMQELEQLQNFLAVNNFKPGQGQISNFERSLIKGAGPSVNNDPETNMRITKVMLGAAQNAKDRLSFRQWYLDKNHKLLGADKAWNDYIERYPRFTSGPGGTIAPTQNRPDWMTYFTSSVGNAPRIGEVRKGYRFKGGDPGVSDNWEKE